MDVQSASTYLRRTAIVLGLAVAAFGASMLAAWMLGVPNQWNAAGIITVKANPSLCLLLVGMALALLNLRRSRRVYRYLAMALACSTLLISGLTLFEHVSRRDLGVDQLIAREAPGAPATGSPNRMGPPATSSLLIASTGLILAALGRRRYAPLCGVAVLLISLVPAVGYLYGVDALFGRPHVTAIAWPTVLALLSVGTGMVLCCLDRGPMALLIRPDSGGKMLRVMLPMAIFLPLGLGFIRMVGQWQGYYGTSEGAAFFALGMVIVFSLVLWWGAGRLSAADRQQRDAEESVRQSEQRLRLLGDNIPGGALYQYQQHADGRARFTHVGAGVEKIFGISARQIMDDAETYWGLVHEEDLAGLREAQLHSARTLAPFHHEFRQRTAAGIRWVHCQSTPRREPDSSIIWDGVLVDITERKLAERELLEAKLALEEASAAKDQFIAKLSHELRTPLTPVVASISSLARDARLPPDLREDLQLVERNIGLEVHLINDLLDVTRIVTGKLALSRQAVDIAQVLQDVARIVTSDLDARDQALVIDTPGAPYWVEADRPRINQVFWNVIKNAIKFSPHHARIFIEAAVAEGAVRVTIRDRGRGIAPDELPRLFRAFEQGAPGQVLGGLGLGLTICKGILDLHGGNISASSDGPGKGSTFMIELPLMALGSEIAAPSRLIDAPEGRRLKILLVEDHADTARVLVRLLKAEGHAVSWAGSVREALAAAEGGRFDIVVCDIGLPDGTGYDLMRELVSRHQNLKGIAVSGYGTAEDVQRALAAGFVEHATKPVSFEALRRALLRVAGATL